MTGIRFLAGGGISFIATALRLGLGPTQPPVHCILGVRQLGCEADYSHLYSAEVKNFMVWCLVKERDTFTFTYDMKASL
jgi:hypothetical protein